MAKKQLRVRRLSRYPNTASIAHFRHTSKLMRSHSCRERLAMWRSTSPALEPSRGFSCGLLNLGALPCPQRPVHSTSEAYVTRLAGFLGMLCSVACLRSASAALYALHLPTLSQLRMTPHIALHSVFNQKFSIVSDVCRTRCFACGEARISQYICVTDRDRFYCNPCCCVLRHDSHRRQHLTGTCVQAIMHPEGHSPA